MIFLDYETQAFDLNDNNTPSVVFTASYKCLVTFEPDKSLTTLPSVAGFQFGVFVGPFVANSDNHALYQFDDASAGAGSTRFATTGSIIIESGDQVKVIARFGRIAGTLHVFRLPESP